MVDDGSIGKDKLSSLIYATPQVNFGTIDSKGQITILSWLVELLTFSIQENLDYALTAATNSNTELIYVTDADTNENLWGRLPVYFDELVSHQTFQCSQG